MNELLRASERLVVTKRHECSERTTKLLQLSDQFGVVSGREYYEHCVVFAKEKKETKLVLVCSNDYYFYLRNNTNKLNYGSYDNFKFSRQCVFQNSVGKNTYFFVKNCA